MRGYIHLHRSILDWDWYKNPVTKSVFIHLLLTANYTYRQYEGTVIRRGQTLTSKRTLSERLGLSEAQIRTALNHLLSTNEIAMSRAPRGALITLKNYDLYQSRNDNRMTNGKQTDNKRYTNNNKNNNNKNNNNYYNTERKNKKPTYDIESVKKQHKAKRLKYEKKSGQNRQI